MIIINDRVELSKDEFLKIFSKNNTLNLNIKTKEEMKNFYCTQRRITCNKKAENDFEKYYNNVLQI